MRILQASTSFPLHAEHAAGIFILELSRGLQDQGVQVRVLAPHAPGARAAETLQGVGVKRLRYFFPIRLQRLCYGFGMPANLKKSTLAKLQLPLLGAAFFFQLLLRMRRYDLVHAHWSLAGLAAVLASKITRVPVVVNVHHGYAFGRVGRLDRYVLEQADAVICNSNFTKGWVLDSTRPKYCEVVPMGVDTDKFAPPAEKPKKNKKLVLSMGRMIPLKGFKYLILAFFNLLEKQKNVQLILVGDGPDRRELEGLVKEQGLKRQVTFLGRIPNERAVEYLHQADCFVLPSIIDEQGNTEGLGVVLLEAMACGVPCIGSKVGGIPDVIRDGENGFLVEERDVQALADRIGLLTRDQELCRKMGAQAREFVVVNFDWKVQSRNLLQVYNSLI